MTLELHPYEAQPQSMSPYVALLGLCFIISMEYLTTASACYFVDLYAIRQGWRKGDFDRGNTPPAPIKQTLLSVLSS